MMFSGDSFGLITVGGVMGGVVAEAATTADWRTAVGSLVAAIAVALLKEYRDKRRDEKREAKHNNYVFEQHEETRRALSPDARTRKPVTGKRKAEPRRPRGAA